MARRPGLSRVEVLVVLLVVGLTAALGVVGITKLRQESARISCANNLKQLGLAIHLYHSSANRLPHLVDQGEGSRTGTGLPSVFHNLIPFLESTPMFYRGHTPPPVNYHARSTVPFTFDNKMGGTGTQHGGDANQVWWRFLDPADFTAEKLRDVPMTLPDGTTGYYATGSYAANGLLPWGGRKMPGKLPDELGATILIAERPQVCVTATGDTVYNLWGVGFYSPHMPAFATLTPPDPPGLWSTGQITPSGNGTVRVGRQDAAVERSDANPVQWIRPGRPCDPRLPGTPHPSGMQAVMADGSVRTFAFGTDPWVFWAACMPTEAERQVPP
jgi:type II secretory pathway pseudopilin PulG